MNQQATIISAVLITKEKAASNAFGELVGYFNSLASDEQQQIRASYHGGGHRRRPSEARELANRWADKTQEISKRHGVSISYQMLKDATE